MRSAAGGDLHHLDHIPVRHGGGVEFAREQRCLVLLHDDRFARQADHGQEVADGQRGVEGAFFAIEGDLHAWADSGASPPPCNPAVIGGWMRA